MKKINILAITLLLIGCSSVQEKIEQKIPLQPQEVLSSVKPLISKNESVNKPVKTKETIKTNVKQHKITLKYCKYLPDKIKDLKAISECEVLKIDINGNKGEEVSKKYAANNKEATSCIKTGAAATKVNLLYYPSMKLQTNEFLREIKTCNGKKCGIDYDYSTSSGTVAILEDEKKPVVITAEFKNLSPKEAYEIVKSIKIK